jgi:TolA-binding protein
MDTLPLLTISGAAVGGVLAGAAACYWPMSRVITELRERLERSEQARNGAVERSTQAREQIAQLNRAITDLRRAHSSQASQVSSREQAEAALSEGDKKLPALADGDTVQPFADTQVMSKL